MKKLLFSMLLAASASAHAIWFSAGGMGGPGSFSSITNTGLTSGRVVYSTTGGLETDSASLTYTVGALTLGVNATQSGTLVLANGAVGGLSWTLASGATSAWTLTGSATAPAQGALMTFSNATGQMSTVADVATGQVLVSGGVGAAPTYSATPTVTTLNGNTFTTGTYTLTGAAGKTLTFNNNLTLAGTDGVTMTTPTTSFTAARTDAANTFTGVQTFNTAIAVSSGGTGGASASGTLLDNITGFASTGFITRTGAGTYAFQSTTNGVTLGNIAQIATNTVLGNSTSGTANVTALSVGGCSSSSSALIWTTNTGFGCNTTIAASTVTTNANLTGPITSSGNATSVAAQTGTGSTFMMQASPAVTGVLTIPDGAVGAPGLRWTSTSTTGIFSSSDNTVRFAISGSETGRFISTGLAITGTVTISAVASSGAAQTGYLCYNTSGGVVTYDSGATCLISREEYKDNMGYMKDVLPEIMALRPFWGRYKEGTPMSDHHVQPFLGARKTASIDPRLASFDKNGEPLGVRYENMSAVLVAAVQEQQKMLMAIRAEIKSLRREISHMKASRLTILPYHRPPIEPASLSSLR